MNKSLALLGLIASITEEGDGQGPLNLMAGAKVKFKEGDQEMAGEICAMDDGSCYNQAEDAYCVKVGDEMLMVKSSELAVSEVRAHKQKPGKPNRYTKTTQAEGKNEDDQSAGDPAAAALDQMKAHVAAVQECYGMMKEMVDPEAHPETHAMLENMTSMSGEIAPKYEAELSIPGDGGGAGVGGTEAEPPAAS